MFHCRIEKIEKQLVLMAKVYCIFLICDYSKIRQWKYMKGLIKISKPRCIIIVRA